MTPTFNPQTNLWYRGSEVLIPFGGATADAPDKLFSLSELKYFSVEGDLLSPYTFHAATDRFTPSDQPHADQLLNPAQIPTASTVNAVNAWAAAVTGFATALKSSPIEGAKPYPNSGSVGTPDPLGPTSILFTDGNGDQGEYDASALAWSLSTNGSLYVSRQLLASLKEQGLK